VFRRADAIRNPNCRTLGPINTLSPSKLKLTFVDVPEVGLPRAALNGTLELSRTLRRPWPILDLAGGVHRRALHLNSARASPAVP
jgi:hypothetical protein